MTRESKTGRRAVSFTIPSGGDFNAEISGIEAAVRKFDVMVREAGTTRSQIVRRFIEECAAEGRILLPEYAPRTAKKEETKAAPIPNVYEHDLFSEVDKMMKDKKEKDSKQNRTSYEITCAVDFNGVVTV